MSDEILRAFADATAEERRLIVLRVAELPPEVGVGLVVLALRDEDWRVRKAAVASAGAVDHAALAPILARALGEHDDVALRNAAVEALASLGRVAVPAARAALGALDADGRKLAVEVLAKVSDTDAVELVVQSLSDSDENVRVAAAEALKRAALAGPAARDLATSALTTVLAQLTKNGELGLAIAALSSLGALHAELAFDVVSPWLADATTSAFALPLVARTADPRVWDVLVDALSLSAAHVRRTAVTALASRLCTTSPDDRYAEAIGRRLRAIPLALMQLRSLADDVDAKERGEALFLLGVAGEPEDVARATNALSDFDVAEWAERALARFDGAVVGSLLDAASDEGSPLREASLSLLPDAGRLPDEALTSDDPKVVVAALLALARSPEHGRLDRLLPFLGRAELRVQSAARLAVLAAAQHAPDVAKAALARAAEASMAKLTLAASGVVDPLADPALAKSLERLLGHEDSRIRQAVVDALAVSKVSRARELLRFALTDEVPAVADAAVRALGTQGASKELSELLVRETSPSRAAKALFALSRADFDLAITRAEELVVHPQAELAAAAVEMIGSAPDAPGVTSALTRALSHTDPEVVRQSLVACARRADTDASIALLSSGLVHVRADVRRLAVHLLATKGEAARILFRSHLASEHDSAVKRAIEDALVGDT